MRPDCATPDGREPCNGYQIVRANLDVEREVQKKLVAERDKWFNEAIRLRAALKPFADYVDQLDGAIPPKGAGPSMGDWLTAHAAYQQQGDKSK